MRTAVVVIGVVILVLVGCVKITTGPPSTAERRSTAALLAKDIAVDWANTFNPAPLPRKFELLQGFMDTVVVRLLAYGRTIADRWDEANRGRGAAMPAGEMQQVVDRSLESDRPILEGYENIIEYSVRTIARDYTADPQVLDQLRGLRDLYYEVYNDVFYPAGEADSYREGLTASEYEWQTQSRELGLTIKRLGP